MKIRLFSIVAFGLALTVAAAAQEAPPEVGPGGMRGGMGGDHGVMGAVTEVAADHYNIKTETGAVYTVHFSASTHIIKQTIQRHDEGSQATGGNGPQSIKPNEIKVGDTVAVMGDVDATAKSVSAMAVVQIDPERAKQMREAQAEFGKTWLMGKVTAINETKITVMSNVDHALHSFVADENTSLRKRRDPITLADIQVGDMVRAVGAVKDGVFVATTISVMGTPLGGAPAQQPK
jgi:preprotein translocase subunit YajC